jgi:uncharacterized circularly permuted ATP-grasp superfamily protein
MVGGIMDGGGATAVHLAGTKGLLASYDPGGYFCELVGSAAQPLTHARFFVERLDQLDLAELRRRASDAEADLFNLGITFTVYSDKNQIDRILPFDVIPRIISAPDWDFIERGLVQRITAMNQFLHDIYHAQHALKDGVLPAELVLGNPNFRPEMVGLDVTFGSYMHICGTDIVRGADGGFRVLEDNGRTPSGVSYVVENRHLMQRAFPDLMRNVGIRNVSDYGQRLVEALADLAPPNLPDPQVVLLSPGVYNSAYFEHIFLAREMGVPLVEGRDLVVEHDRVYMKTVGGLQPVHVIYRRLNDDFLDPEAFNPASMLGVPGLFRCFKKGTVVLANAIGTGVVDDKATYAYVPRLIKYYLDQDAILPNVETYLCREPEGLTYTLEHLDDLVTKPVGESGGYGITIGPRATREELEEARARIIARPDNYVSQPMVALSVCPSIGPDGIAPRHVDLRPFAITGRSTWVLPGGLSRVALKEGSFVVNSSQGGGSKDTWVLEA